ELAHRGDRVEVAVAEEKAALGERAHDVLVVEAVDGEGDRGRAPHRRRRTVKPGDRRKAVPQHRREAIAFVVERLVRAAEALAARARSFTVPFAFDAPPMAMSFVRGETSSCKCSQSICAVSRIIRIERTTTPRSICSARHGATLAW